MEAPKRQNKSKENAIKALEQNLGIVTIACRAANISRKTFYKWLKEDEEFKAAVQDVYEMQGDYVENQLLKNIKAGDTSSIIFYCKTRLKSRGYVEKKEQEVMLDTKQPINISIVRDKRCGDSIKQ